MKFAEKRIHFSRKCNHLERRLEFMGIQYAVDWNKRDIETQTRFVNAGSSKTLNSKHLQGLARDYLLYDDILNYITDGDHDYYQTLGAIAKDLGLTWGGDWGWDAGHVEYKEGS
jgi:hypothetical protein